MKKFLPIAIGFVIIAGLLFLVTNATARNNLAGVNAQQKNQPTPELKPHTNISSSISVSVSGARNLKKLNYTIDSADMSSEIIVNGQRVQSVNGKTFLVLNIKITNDNQQAVQINSRDYIRLQATNGSEEWWAPEIFNDPLEIQAISTKLSRIGFSVDNNQKNFKLRVGEVGGEKKEVGVDF